MINQFFLASAGSHILCTVKSACHIDEVKGFVLLLPGFSQSSSDIDYFLTNLSNELNLLEYGTVQIDLFGHGDSYGKLPKLNLKIIEDNILSVYSYISEELCINKPIIGVARGIYANILSNERISNKFDKTICINPVVVHLGSLDLDCWKNELEIEISNIINTDKSLKDLFVLMGAELTNLSGQKISSIFLDEILEYIKNQHFIANNSVVITSYNDTDKLYKVDQIKDINKHYDIEYLSAHCFIRDPEWQITLIDVIGELVKGEINEGTISNYQ